MLVCQVSSVMDQSEARTEITRSVSTNQRPVFRSRDPSGPIRGQYSGSWWSESTSCCCLMTSCPLVGDYHRVFVTSKSSWSSFSIHRNHSDFLGNSGKLMEEIYIHLPSVLKLETFKSLNYVHGSIVHCNVIMVCCLNHEMMDGIKE